MLNVAHLTQDLTSLFGECRKCSPMKCRIFVASRMYWNNKKYNKHDHQNLQYFVYLFFFDTELQNCAKPLPNPSNLTDSSTHTHTHTDTIPHSVNSHFPNEPRLASYPWFSGPMPLPYSKQRNHSLQLIFSWQSKWLLTELTSLAHFMSIHRQKLSTHLNKRLKYYKD